MSWAKRFGFGNWSSGQVSPGAPPSRQDGNSNTVTDSDFSYITEEDIKNQQEHGANHHHGHHSRNRPSRDTDVLAFRYRNNQHQVHFPAWSISDGQLSVGDAREKIASRLEIGDARRIRLFWKGRNLKTDEHTLADEGMRSEDSNEVLCVVGDTPLDGKGDPDDSGSEGSVDGAEDDSGTGDGKARKKKRKGKKKKNNRKGGASTPASPGYSTAGAGAEHLPIPAGLHPSHRDSSASSTPGRGPSPQPPQTPMAKLQAIEDKYKNEMVPGAEAYLANPPFDPAKKQFEQKKHAETILAQVLLKLDGVEVEGDDDARAKRKALVKETQALLNRLDASVKQ